MALLKLNVDFDPMVIGAEGARLLREKRVKGDPTGAKRRGGSRTARLERKSTGKMTRAFCIRISKNAFEIVTGHLG
jgi:hypothetical protein